MTSPLSDLPFAPQASTCLPPPSSVQLHPPTPPQPTPTTPPPQQHPTASSSIPEFTWTNDPPANGQQHSQSTHSATFKSHVRHLTDWFSKLRGCEQLLALFSLVRGLYPSYLKIFSAIVDQVTSVSFINDTDLEKLESQANDVEYLSSLYYAPRGQMVSRLLQAFPLLKTVSSQPHVNQIYIDLLVLALTGANPRVDHSHRHSGHSTSYGGGGNCISQAGDEVLQLFSLALIHPSLSQDDHGQIADLVHKQRLGQPVPPQQHHHYQGPAQADSGLGLDNSVDIPTTPSTHRHLTRQLSLAPPGLQPSSPGYLTSPGSFDSVGGTCSHPALSPQSSISSGGGCDTPADETGQLPTNAASVHLRSSSLITTSSPGGRNMFLEEASGMKNVPAWLKSLRLHKYANLFQHLSYDEMLEITDEWLEARNVTRGARNKILVSIKRLRDRESTLQQLEADITRSDGIRNCLLELRDILSSPIKPAPTTTEHGLSTGPEGDEDTGGGRPGRIIDSMFKVYNQLLTGHSSDDDIYAMFVNLIDSVLEQQVFTSRQKYMCTSWKQQMEDFRGPPLRRFNWDNKVKKATTASNLSQPIPPWTLPSGGSGNLGPGSCLLSTCPPRHLTSWSPSPAPTSPFNRPTPPSGGPRIWPPNPSPCSHPTASHLSQPPPPLMKQHTLGGGETLPPPPGGAMFACTTRPRIKRPVERTHSAPTQYSFQGYSLLDQGVVLDAGGGPSYMQSGTGGPPTVFIPSSTFDHSTSLSNNPLDSFSTTEINRNLDLLARKVTELAIGDSDDNSDES